MTADSTGAHGTALSPPPSNRRISIIVPTLNEAENVDALIGDILGATSALGQVEVIVVDDGSTDGTRQRIMAWEADPSARGAVRLLARDGERGLAQAILAGAKHAGGEILVVMDADLSHPAQQIPDLVKPILDGNSDMAIGSRYVPGASMPGRPAKRRLMSRATTLLAWPFTVVSAMLFYGAALHYLVLGLPPLRYPEGFRLVGWHDLGSQIERIEDDVESMTGSEPLVVGMDKYRIASELAFYRTHAEMDTGSLSKREGIEETGVRAGAWQRSARLPAGIGVSIGNDAETVASKIREGR